jgi:ribonuclease HI
MIDDNKDKLEVLISMIEQQLESVDMLCSSEHFLKDLLSVARAEKKDEPDFSDGGRQKKIKQPKLIISTDASILNNPGGPAAVGVVIDMPGVKQQSYAKLIPSQTSNQAEYDAIYEGLTTTFGLFNNPGINVEVHSDSQVTIKQLLSEYGCNDEKLLHRKESILELVKALPVKIEFKWRPRCSTASMKLADELAYNAIQEMKKEKPDGI